MKLCKNGLALTFPKYYYTYSSMPSFLAAVDQFFALKILDTQHPLLYNIFVKIRVFWKKSHFQNSNSGFKKMNPKWDPKS